MCVGVLCVRADRERRVGIYTSIDRHRKTLFSSERTAQRKTITGMEVSSDKYVKKRLSFGRLSQRAALGFCFPFLKDDRVRCETSFRRQLPGRVEMRSVEQIRRRVPKIWSALCIAGLLLGGGGTNKLYGGDRANWKTAHCCVIPDLVPKDFFSTTPPRMKDIQSIFHERYK